MTTTKIASSNDSSGLKCAVSNPTQVSMVTGGTNVPAEAARQRIARLHRLPRIRACDDENRDRIERDADPFVGDPELQQAAIASLSSR